MKRFLAVPCAILLLTTSSEAWTSKTYQLIVVQSMKLMPQSFQRVFLRHQQELLSGSLHPDNGPETDHRYDCKSRTGFLQDRILQLAREIPEMINSHHPFQEIAYKIGGLSHYMSDLNDPLLLEHSDPREPQYRLDFAVYLEKNIDQFPWVFDGHEQPDLIEGKLEDYIFRIASKAAGRYPRIGEAYFPNGVLVSSDTFDPRSLPFGIASLSYSHSISNTIQIWFYVWRQAHGDISKTPFYSGEKQKEKQ